MKIMQAGMNALSGEKKDYCAARLSGDKLFPEQGQKMNNHLDFNRQAAVECIAVHTGIKSEDIAAISISKDLLEDYQEIIQYSVPEIKTFGRVSKVFAAVALSSLAVVAAEPGSQEIFKTNAYPEIVLAGGYMGSFGFGLFACLFGWHVANLKHEINQIGQRIQKDISRRSASRNTTPSPE